MKKFKQLLCLALALTISASLLAACGQKNNGGSKDSDEKVLTYAVEGGSAGEEIALEKGWKVTTLEDQAAALMEVASGTSDAAIIDLLMAGAMIGEGTSYPDLTYTDRLTEEEYGIGCRKGSDLAQYINCVLGDAYQSGTMQKLAQQYGISVGKASLIQEVIAQDSTLTFASLAPLSVNEIALIAESRHLTTQAVTQTGTASTKAYITAEEAQNAALAHAGIAESSVAQLEIEFDSEDGLMVYEVEFKAGTTEYQYEIDLYTGAVLKSERESHSVPASGSSGPHIGEAAAKSAALTHAGVSESDASRIQVELDRDDGRTLDEVEFHVGRTEYSYEIDASSGAIVKAEQELDD